MYPIHHNRLLQLAVLYTDRKILFTVEQVKPKLLTDQLSSVKIVFRSGVQIQHPRPLCHGEVFYCSLDCHFCHSGYFNGWQYNAVEQKGIIGLVQFNMSLFFMPSWPLVFLVTELYSVTLRLLAPE